MCSCLRGVSRWFTPLACGPGYLELSKSYMDMASKLFTFTFTGWPSQMSSETLQYDLTHLGSQSTARTLSSPHRQPGREALGLWLLCIHSGLLGSPRALTGTLGSRETTCDKADQQGKLLVQDQPT